MSVFTDTDILEIHTTNLENPEPHQLAIKPFSEDALTPVGYDLRIGYLYKSSRDKKAIELNDGDRVVLRGGSTTSIRTMEWVRMPSNRSLSGLICSKVSLVSLGLSHISTTVDPDWSGELLITIHNHTNKNINMTVGDSICTLVFLENRAAATKLAGFPSSRTDVLVSKISSDDFVALKTKQRRNIYLKGGFFGMCLVVFAIILYFAVQPRTELPEFNAMILAGCVVFAAVLLPLVEKFLSRARDD